MIDDMVKIIHINAYIQRGMGKVLHNEHEIICVALDMTYALEKEGIGEVPLSHEELDALFRQTFGFLKEE